ncbi:ABC transporter ATP-binding/permease protein YojI [Kordia antarctica]|uniref:ABC transporter ATP-binding/permease protein YojI n=1 Tax=Kordia antarctica TaxID=1218801 RepID=A0A7L4ZHJ3_9FLAO|nr:ATP-binding cassette domain-containing protein [Kordia antarctica]QHI35394.1 ABC transporter ATP-binding/permease protein YojI [Kordia antarctica]
MIRLKIKNIVYIILYALPNTILSFGIVYIINNVLSGNQAFLGDHMGIVFLALIGYTYLLNIVFQKWLNKFAFDVLYDNEKKIFNQILSAPMRSLERFGSKRFLTAVEDLRTFSQLPYTVTHTVNSVLMLVLCLVYMFSLSSISALIVIGLIAIVAACYFVVINSMSSQVSTLREYNEDYYQYVGDVIDGFQELKLSFFRRTNLMNKFLVPNRDLAKKLDFKISYIFLSVNLISQYGLYVVIAVILFVLPGMGILPRADVISYVVIIMFVSGPINNLINLQQMYTRFIVANSRINRFLNDFKLLANDVNLEVTESLEFESLVFKDVYFYYDEENKESFALGPINLEIKKGETIFIVGGNGSGKSTFINALTGIYDPSMGEIALNGKTENIKGDLQNIISSVFTQNHIFSNNYDNYKIEGNTFYNEWLEIMKLKEVVADDKEESARRGFSKGQSKRMSLIFALLEEKPIIVLDEWAADQDPQFRKYFYEELIPKLQEMGKTIIAVTHDDAYFHNANRIIKFDYGQIVRDVPVISRQELTESLWQ